MKLTHLYILILGLIFLSSFALVQKTKTTTDLQLITAKTNYIAGSKIVLKFSASQPIKPLLYCTNSYGTLLIEPTLNETTLYYKLPKAMYNKKGVIHWVLNDTALKGKLTVQPIQKVKTMETYIGPPSIEAGGKDYSMFIVIPTDSLDNVLTENTLVTAKHQFLNKQYSDALYIKNGIAYKNLYSPLKNGRILASSNCLGTNSKEYTVIVYPSNPTNFTITANKHHSYADGNQITTFYTSIIKDAYNNIVSDGSFVTFFIKNKKGAILKTIGTTIKGIATAKMIHPDYETTWSVKAYIEGMAESNTISLEYLAVLKEFNVTLTKKNRLITVGPLQSFMQQMIPDGLEVCLSVYKNNTLIHTTTKTSYKGFVSFNLDTAVYKKDTYTFKITTAGLEKELKEIRLW